MLKRVPLPLLFGLCVMVKTFGAEEPVKLESTFVGDKEQPPVSYFIPWQGVGPADKFFTKDEIKLDNSLEAVDRDVLIRSVRVYKDMNMENR